MAQPRTDGERMAVLENQVANLEGRIDRVIAAQESMIVTMTTQHGEMQRGLSEVRVDVAAIRATIESWHPPRGGAPRDWAAKGGIGAALATVAGGVAYAVLQMVSQGE